MDNEIIYIDFDGVILDSDKRLYDRMVITGFNPELGKSEYLKYFEYTNSCMEEWNHIISEAKSVNNSVEIIKELEHLNKKIAILTKIHTLTEMQVKVNDIRNNRNIKCPIIFVPPKAKKHDVVLPNGNVLVDDFDKNIRGWNAHGGNGILFDSKTEEETNTQVRSLEFLLKR